MDNLMNIRSLTRALCAALCAVFVALAAVTAGEAGPPAPVVGAFYLRKLPETYTAQEKLFAAFKGTGINTVILDMPLTESGHPDIDAVPNAVFLAHQAGVRLQIVLPTRFLRGPLAEHDDWEDRAYDLNRDGYVNSGKMDLFNTAAVEYLVRTAKELASFSVDGLILGPDFSYGQLEGMSRTAAKFAAVKLDADIEPSRMYKKLGKGPAGRYIQDYSDLFPRWAGLKRDRLIAVFESIRSAARAANASLTFGIILPSVDPAATPAELLANFAFDLEAYRKKDADYFLAVIDYREMQEQRNLSYKQATEVVSRTARSVLTAVKPGPKVVFILPMTERLTGRSLRFSEIEEINGMIRGMGESGFGYVIKTDTELNPSYTAKLFRK